MSKDMKLLYIIKMLIDQYGFGPILDALVCEADSRKYHYECVKSSQKLNISHNYPIQNWIKGYQKMIKGLSQAKECWKDS